jgi:hypothetical protein
MKRSFNSTGRKKISQDLVRFKVYRDALKTPLAFAADVEGLRHLGVPDSSRIYVEASIKHSSIRFDFGTIGQVTPPSECKLDELDRGNADVCFRVMVVDDAGHLGRLLAAGDGFTDESEVEDGTGRKPILPAEESPLGQQIWDVQINQASGPRLLINSAIPGLIEKVRKDPLLRGAIVPEAFRRIVRFMLEEADEDPSWFSDWKRLLEEELGLARVDDVDEGEEAIKEYADEAVRRFTDANKFAAKALPEDVFEGVMYD